MAVPNEPEQGSAASASPSQAVTSETLDIIVPTNNDGKLPVDLWVGCKSGPQFQISDLDEIVLLTEGDPGGVAQAIQPFLSGAEGRFWPQANWLMLRETVDEVLLVHVDPDGLAFMNVNRVGGAWIWSGSQRGGPCPLYYVVPDGPMNVNIREETTQGLDGA